MESSCNSLSIMEGSSFPVPKNIQLHKLFQLNLRRNCIADRVAVLFEDGDTGQMQHITYAMLEAKSNQIARRLLAYLEGNNRKKANLDGDFVITVYMEPSEKLIITLLAIWKLGATYLPLDISSPKNRIEHILGEVRPMVIISDRNVEVTNFPYVINYGVIEEESSVLPVESFTSSECSQNEDNSIAIILYTSGSTGVPKGVRLPHNVIMNRLSWQWRTFPFSDTEYICVAKTALTFVDAVAEIWGPILYSDPRTLLIIPKSITKDPEKLVRVLDTYKIERLILVPSLLQTILLYLDMINKQSCTNYDLLKHLKLWICSGESLPASLVEGFFGYFEENEHKLCNFYGSTEIMGDVSYYVVHSTQQLQYEDKIPIGVPLDNTLLYLLDGNFQPVQRGEIGELYVAGYNVAAGYVIGRDSNRFIQNPFTSQHGFDKLYKTGDYGKIGNNVLLYEGRTDSQIKVRGQRVDLSEVQTALCNLNAVQKAAVLCHKPGDINQSIVAFVTLNPGCAATANEIQSKIGEYLVTYAIPQVFIIDQIPLLNNGKVDRQILLKMYSSNSEKDGQESQTETDYKGIEYGKLKAAKCLFETIISVLGVTGPITLSTKSNFYEIGGNSLNSIHTITKLREKGFFIGIGDFISAPDLGTIVGRMQLGKQDKENIPDLIDLKAKDFRKSGYKYEMLSEKHKDAVFRIITDSFYEKADLEQWLVPKPKPECYVELMEAIWAPLVAKNFSFAVYSENHERYVAACLNFDAHDEPDVTIQSNLIVIFEFLEFLEGPIRDKQLPLGKRQLFHNFMVGTDTTLNATENIEVVTFMEKKVIKIAKRKGFAGVFTTNTNPLTQQLGRDVFKYHSLLEYQVNQYTAPDGTKPFAEAPSEQKCIVAWKPII